MVPVAIVTRISAQSHRAALRDISVLIRHEIYDLMRAVLRELTGIRHPCIAQYAAWQIRWRRSAFQDKCQNTGSLSSAAYFGSSDLSLNATVSEAARAPESRITSERIDSAVSSVTSSASIHLISTMAPAFVSAVPKCLRHAKDRRHGA